MIQGELRVHQEDKQSKASRNYARTHNIQHKTWKKQQDTQETTQQAEMEYRVQRSKSVGTSFHLFPHVIHHTNVWPAEDIIIMSTAKMLDCFFRVIWECIWSYKWTILTCILFYSVKRVRSCGWTFFRVHSSEWTVATNTRRDRRMFKFQNCEYQIIFIAV